MIDPLTQPVQVHISNPAGWLSAVAALVSTATAFIAVVFSRLSNKAALGISKIDKIVNILPSECSYILTFSIKNFGKEKIKVVSTRTQTFNLQNNQLLLVHSSSGGFPYFQDSESLQLTVNQTVNPPYPTSVNPLDPNSPGNWAFYKQAFPMFLVVLTLEYERRGKLFMETVKEIHIYEANLIIVSPVGPEKYPALMRLLS